MGDNKARMEGMLFNYETTYRTTYQDIKIKPKILTKYKGKKSCLMTRPPPLKDVHTFTDFKQPIAFHVMHKPKDILHTNPHDVQRPYSKPIDHDRKRAQLTRPKLVMTPAVSLDDVEDDVRDILIKETYTSDMTRSNREAVKDYFSVRAPFPGKPAPANPIFLPCWVPGIVPPEWRKECINWDYHQLRAHCDPDQRFWLAQTLPPCHACKETAQVVADRNFKRQLKN